MKTCKKHPKYKAIFKPRCDCKECWEIWKESVSMRVAGAKIFLERMKKINDV